eukprot:CAMPEP_0114576920 /NCGR_PEP_ID=MMETSP0125-20121206/1640_1 /TAXON_ID=485358 ORGANISM="Aristerostoma sp., Strain ATCC 50986" /NCGR_SAMPLE_ID=MMETSP0125 /ASSEMBLY_ACC=CAM_ASM_000245 /LENGTH=77 /DNA_ID=CAMNT_0001765833 /DNA_START=1088 /DNA_END=1321 /DNA_ORIENTATION=-
MKVKNGSTDREIVNGGPQNSLNEINKVDSQKENILTSGDEGSGIKDNYRNPDYHSGQKKLIKNKSNGYTEEITPAEL